MSVRVVLADDQTLVLGGFRMLIEAREDLEVVGEARQASRRSPSSSDWSLTSAVLLLTFAIEPAVLALAPDVGRYGPLAALPAAAQDVPAGSVGLEGVNLLDPWLAVLAVLALLAWIGAAFVAGAALLRDRDLH